MNVDMPYSKIRIPDAFCAASDNIPADNRSTTATIIGFESRGTPIESSRCASPAVVCSPPGLQLLGLSPLNPKRETGSRALALPWAVQLSYCTVHLGCSEVPGCHEATRHGTGSMTEDRILVDYLSALRRRTYHIPKLNYPWPPRQCAGNPQCHNSKLHVLQPQKLVPTLTKLSGPTLGQHQPPLASEGPIQLSTNHHISWEVMEVLTLTKGCSWI